ARELAFVRRAMRCRRSRADISADAEISASRLAGDTELLQLRLQRREFHAQAGGRTGESSDHPTGFAEDAQKWLTLGRFQGLHFVENRHGWCFQFPTRN